MRIATVFNWVSGSILTAGLLLTGCSRDLPAATSEAAETGTTVVERGRYLVATLGCGDCHTPLTMGANGPEPDMARMLSGHPEGVDTGEPPEPRGQWVWFGSAQNTAFAGPWGISYAINLTPDENSGIGIWTEEIFVKTLRTGRHWGAARPILPPMPWQAYSQLTDEDLKAVYAYLRTVPSISNRVPEAKLAG